MKTKFASFAPLLVALGLVGAALSGCATMGVKSAVSLKVERAAETPKDALVYIDGNYVGTLATVVSRGVRLPEGPHRIRVEKNGYHPYSAEVVSDWDNLKILVELLRLPD